MGRPAKPRQNPIYAAVNIWLGLVSPPLVGSSANVNDANEAKQLLLGLAPKRWVVYEPMVLLPSGSFASSSWVALLDALPSTQKDLLWTAILQQLSPASPKPPLTHLAINEPIPLHLSLSKDDAAQRSSEQEDVSLSAEQGEEENILRSPTSLRPLYGDFGPLLPASVTPTAADFDRALWVSTTQNGLRQVWSPRYTMFSRGNVKEKARVLGFPVPDGTTRRSSSRGTGTRRSQAPEPTLAVPTSTCTPTPAPAAAVTTSTPAPPPPPGGRRAEHADTWAVDLYAGIGYFAFSYAARGLRVLCWELNAWSAEGLRRGAEANGFSVRVVYPVSSSSSSTSSSTSTTTTMTTITAAIGTDAQKEEEDFARAIASPAQIIVFVQDNRLAAGQIRRHWQKMPSAGRVVHVNCGFLPTSAPVWRDAWEILGVTNHADDSSVANCGGGESGFGSEGGDGGKGEDESEADGWLHLHENVAEKDIEARWGEMQALFYGWSVARDGDVSDRRGRQRTAEVRHVEKVKTYAPGVWHCVFDVCCSSSRSTGE